MKLSMANDVFYVRIDRDDLIGPTWVTVRASGNLGNTAMRSHAHRFDSLSEAQSAAARFERGAIAVGARCTVEPRVRR